jgi:hypothetical protein
MIRTISNWVAALFWPALLLTIMGLVLAGCVTTGGPTSTNISPVCRALIGPIRYNSTNHGSRRFAGDLLSYDLAERNQVGRSLHCPAYRR